MAPDTVASASPHAIHSRAQGASLIQVESSKLLPLILFSCTLSSIALVTCAFTFYQLTKTEREYRMVQLQVMDQNAVLIREGLKQPTDTNFGAAGNYQYKPKEKH